MLEYQLLPVSAPPMTKIVPSGSRQDQGMTLGAGISSRSQEPFLSVRSMRQLAGLASVSLAQRSVEHPPKMITCMQGIAKMAGPSAHDLSMNVFYLC